jgi:hypothetical protein
MPTRNSWHCVGIAHPMKQRETRAFTTLFHLLQERRPCVRPPL